MSQGQQDHELFERTWHKLINWFGNSFNMNSIEVLCLDRKDDMFKICTNKKNLITPDWLNFSILI